MSQRTLYGPNIWARQQVAEIQVDASRFHWHEWPKADEMLMALGLDPVGLLNSLGVDELAEWLSTAAIELQRALGSPVEFRNWRDGSRAGELVIAIEFEEDSVAALVVEALRHWLEQLAQGQTPSHLDDWNDLQDQAYDLRLGNTTGAIVVAAQARGIPWMRLDDQSLVQLGQGSRQRRVWRATTDRTGMMANTIAVNKQLTKRLLQELGIRMAEGRQVSDALDACQAADELGWPVVVKPIDADYGNGVSIRLTSKAEVVMAFSKARRWSEHVLVERFVTGNLYRLTVINGQLAGAVRREPAFVVGDGQQTILELVQEANQDPYRGNEFSSPLNRSDKLPTLSLDDWPNDYVPPLGQAIQLVGDVYMRMGGVQVDRTHDVHPEIVAMVLDAARIVGLDIAGIDLIAEDIALAPDEQSFAVLEINAEPAIILHQAPLCVPPRPVAAMIVDSLIPIEENPRIPLIAVLDNSSDLAFACRLMDELQRHGEVVGLACRDGAWLGQKRLGPTVDSTGKHLRRLWQHPRIDVVIVKLALDEILHEGVPFEICDQLVEAESASCCCRSGDSPDHARALECLRSTRIACVPE